MKVKYIRTRLDRKIKRTVGKKWRAGKYTKEGVSYRVYHTNTHRERERVIELVPRGQCVH